MQSSFSVVRSQESRQVWDHLIARYGEIAVLRQSGLPDRQIRTVFGQYTTMERLGGISNPADMKAIVSATAPDTGVELSPKPSERDTLITTNEDGSEIIWKIVAPPVRIGTNSNQLYWRLSVRR